MAFGLLHLPHEILLNILTLVKRTDLKALRLVCQFVRSLVDPLLFSKLVTPRLDSRIPFDECWVIRAESSVPWAQLRHVREIALGVSTDQNGLPAYHLTVPTPVSEEQNLARKLRCIATIFALVWERIDRAKLVRIGALCGKDRGTSPFLLDDSIPKMWAPDLRSLRSLEVIYHPCFRHFSPRRPIFSPWDVSGLEYLQWRGLFPKQMGKFQRLLMANSQTLRKVSIEMSERYGNSRAINQQSGHAVQPVLSVDGPTAFPVLESVSILGSPLYGLRKIFPGGCVLHGPVLENLRSLKMRDFAGSLYVSRLDADHNRKPSKLESLELSYVRWYPKDSPFELFKIMAASSELRDCFISIWDTPLGQQNADGLGPRLHERWPALLEPVQSRVLRRLVLEGVSLRVLGEARSEADSPLSEYTTPDNVLAIPAVTKHIIKSEIECLGVSLDLREIHVFASSLHHIAQSSSSLKLLHMRWPGLLQKHAPKAWNSSSLFDWPTDCTWYRHINGFSASAQTAIHIFNIPLIYSTDKIPHDLQKVVHWAFGPTGFPNLQVIAFGDFGTPDEAWRRETALFCRNDADEPWEASHLMHTAGLSLNIRPNFRLVTPRDWACRELVERNLDFLSSCPCKSALEDAHDQLSMADLQRMDSRFQVIEEDDDEQDERQVTARHHESLHLASAQHPSSAGE